MARQMFCATHIFPISDNLQAGRQLRPTVKLVVGSREWCLIWIAPGRFAFWRWKLLWSHVDRAAAVPRNLEVLLESGWIHAGPIRTVWPPTKHAQIVGRSEEH